VMAIFAARLLNDKPPLSFEDGRQRRDFVHVTDIARACRLALERDEATGEAFNIGSGRSVTVAELAERLAVLLNRAEIAPRITGEYRVGDIRHCFADVTKARVLLGFSPRIPLEDGMAELADWLAGQHADDHCERAYAELTERGLAS
jgi:dTDP-L-rhamnose 4-epimerase